MTRDALVVVRGGGDLGTGVAHRLVESGCRVVVLETGTPTVVRRRVAFAEAVRSGEVTVEGVVARRVQIEDLPSLGRPGWVPVVVDPDGRAIGLLDPACVVDARMAKRNLGTRIDDAPVTIGLGPGFEAGRDVDLVVETARGDSLGRLIETGFASPNTGVPGEVGGAGRERVMRSPAAGVFRAERAIGDLVEAGEVVGTVDGEPVRARIAGLVRGLVADGVALPENGKVGDVDPRGREVDPGIISDKARAIGAAIHEARLRRGLVAGEHTRGSVSRREVAPD
jgi:xanthine dehydrogenase accessory factor